MIIRAYTHTDLETISKLFYETVHHVNSKDYTKEQLFAWAKDTSRLQERRKDLLKQKTLVAEIDGVIVGFGSIDRSGCLDLLYVHKDFQRRGIATALCNHLEKGFITVKTYASITAKPFFEKRGYLLIKCQEVEREGIKLKNFEMKKSGNCSPLFHP